jgi:hypothetical protein
MEGSNIVDMENPICMPTIWPQNSTAENKAFDSSPREIPIRVSRTMRITSDRESAGNWGRLVFNSGKQTSVIMKIVTTRITRGTLPSPKSGIAEKIPANRPNTRVKKVNSLMLATGRKGNTA